MNVNSERALSVLDKASYDRDVLWLEINEVYWFGEFSLEENYLLNHVGLWNLGGRKSL